MNNDPIIWAMLNAIEEQPKQITAQQNLIRKQQRLTRAQQLEITTYRKLMPVSNTRLQV